MTIQWSTALRNARLSAIPNTVGASAILRLYSGSLPANCATALGGGNLNLAEFDLAATWESAPSNGVMALANTPITTTGNSAAGSGTTATFYRIYASDGVTCHEQGAVSEPGGGGDVLLDNVNIANGQQVQITALTKTEPGA